MELEKLRLEKEKEIGIIYYHDSLAKYFNNKLIDWKLSNKININNFLHLCTFKTPIFIKKFY